MSAYLAEIYEVEEAASTVLNEEDAPISLTPLTYVMPENSGGSKINTAAKDSSER